jgi:hypothetical protein
VPSTLIGLIVSDCPDAASVTVIRLDPLKLNETTKACCPASASVNVYDAGIPWIPCPATENVIVPR